MLSVYELICVTWWVYAKIAKKIQIHIFGRKLESKIARHGHRCCLCGRLHLTARTIHKCITAEFMTAPYTGDGLRRRMSFSQKSLTRKFRVHELEFHYVELQ